MEVKTCKKCGKLFQYSGIGEMFCPICKQKDEEDFEKVKKYINDNPGEKIEKVAEDTEVSVKLITKWLREERLVITKGSNLLTCEKCGKPIAMGKLCDACKQNLAKGFIESGIGAKKMQTPPPKDKPQEKGMHFLKT